MAYGIVSLLDDAGEQTQPFAATISLGLERPEHADAD
jgi:hypothetical protein